MLSRALQSTRERPASAGLFLFHKVRAAAIPRVSRNEIRHEGVFNIRWTQPIAKAVLPREDWKRSRLKSRLVRAGYRQERALHIFLASKVILGFAVPILLAMPMLIMGKMPALQPTVSVSLLVLSALIGYYLPDAYLDRVSRERQLRFTEGFPDAMDMLVVCVEAGLGLDAAIQRVGRLEALHVHHTAATLLCNDPAIEGQFTVELDNLVAQASQFALQLPIGLMVDLAGTMNR